VPSGSVTGVISRSKNPVLRQRPELVHLDAADVLELRHVLRGLSHRDVDVGQSDGGRPRSVATLGARGGTGLRIGEQHVVRARDPVRSPVCETTHRLHTSRHEHVALAGPNRVRRHADRLERGGAIAVHRHPRDAVEPGQEGHDAGEIEPRLACRLPVAEDQVLDLRRVELGHLREQRPHDLCGQVVGPHVNE
jgi:hypothetical protein